MCFPPKKMQIQEALVVNQLKSALRTLASPFGWFYLENIELGRTIPIVFHRMYEGIITKSGETLKALG